MNMGISLKVCPSILLKSYAKSDDLVLIRFPSKNCPKNVNANRFPINNYSTEETY